MPDTKPPAADAEVKPKTWAPDNKKWPDAIWIAASNPACESKSKLTRLAGALFGMKPGSILINVPLQLIDGGRLVRRSATDPGYHWPTDHENARTHRHEWFDVEGREGVKVGFLLDDPELAEV